MSDEIGFRRDAHSPPGSEGPGQLVPMSVGDATVYVEQIGEPLTIETREDIYTVAPPDPDEAFERAGEVLHECVRVVGERVGTLAENAMPKSVAVEFTLSFEASGRAQIVPVLLTGQTKVATGLKVTAVWGS
jgi:hypothetical protein